VLPLPYGLTFESRAAAAMDAAAIDGAANGDLPGVVSVPVRPHARRTVGELTKMSRTVRCGLVQTACDQTQGDLAEIKKSALEAHASQFDPDFGKAWPALGDLEDGPDKVAH